MKNIIRAIVLVLSIVSTLSGCASMRSGGAPDPSFNIDKDIQELTTKYSSASNIADFYASPTKEARDRFITGRLVLMDLQYLKFIRTLTSDKQQLDSATDIVNLTLNLAGTLVGGVQAKTNLAALGAGVSGSKTVIDKNYYYEKSINALVATMNAHRKEVVIKILEGLPHSLDMYPLTQAVIDLNVYYLAGTLNGALQYVQADAGKLEAKSDETIKGIRIAHFYTKEEIDITKELTDAIGSAGFDLKKAKKALKELGLDDAKIPESHEEAKALLKGYVRKANPGAEIKQVRDAFKNAGLL